VGWAVEEKEALLLFFGLHVSFVLFPALLHFVLLVLLDS